VYCFVFNTAIVCCVTSVHHISYCYCYRRSSVHLQGLAVECGDMLRIVHVNTNKHLHSHLHRSPLTQRQEVSAFGDHVQNQGDTGMLERNKRSALGGDNLKI
jgi:dolichyl-phosphate-mannose--protein O-mannosyl transferase